MKWTALTCGVVLLVIFCAGLSIGEPIGKQPPQFGLLQFQSDRGSGVVLHDRGSYASVEIRNNENDGPIIAFMPETETENVNRPTLWIKGDGLRVRTAKGKVYFIGLESLAALGKLEEKKPESDE